MIAYFAGHPTAANLLMAGIMVLGITTVGTLQRETFPDFAASEVEVRVPYPGAAAQEVEEAVCQRLEEALESVEDVAEQRCEARESLATMVVEMAPSGRIDRFQAEIRAEVEAIDDFPAEVERPVVRERGRVDLVVALAITGEMSPIDLHLYARDVRERMLRQGIGTQITLQGFADRQIRVELAAGTLRQLGLAVDDIAALVARDSLDVPAGTVTTAEREILLRFSGEARRVAEVEDLEVLATAEGAVIRLGDIATVREELARDEVKILLGGRRAAVLEIAKSRTQDTLRVMDEVTAFVADERERAPQGVVFALTRDVSSIVRDRLAMLVTNGAQGLALVLLAMWLFFSLRFAFWVAMGLPVSFLGTLFVMTLLGYSLNMMTMVALLIAIGLLMDDAIVIAENIATRHRQGRPLLAAAIEGTREVGPGVLASFLTTVCVFAPLAFLEGQIGRVLAVLPVVLIVTLAVSFVEAFLILPNHLAHAARRAAERPPHPVRARIERGFERLREKGLGRLVDASVDNRHLALGLAVGLFLASLAMVAGGVLKFRAFPEIDGDVLEARLLLPQGTPLERTEQVVERIVGGLARVEERFGRDQPGGSLVRQVVVQYDRNPDAFDSGPHLATITADLLGAEQRTVTIDQIAGAWRAAVGQPADVIGLTYKEPFLGPAGQAIELRLIGQDLDRLARAADALRDWLAGYEGAQDLIHDLRPGKPELRLTLRDGSRALGLDGAAVAAQLRAAFQGVTAREFQRGRESYEIDLRLGALDRGRLGALDEFTLSGRDGALVPLEVVARLEPVRGFGRVQRIDGERVATVRGDIDAAHANAAAIVADTRARFAPVLAERFPEIRLWVAGQDEESARTGASLVRGFAIGLVGIFLLLSFLFRSYVEPLVVMLAIPLALIGVIWGHLLMGLELSMPSVIGFASLAGIVVNNSILLVAFVKRNHATGMSVPEAARLASRQRLRAVLLTSLTTIAGLLPLLTETSLQAQVLIPLVTSLAFGLMASSLLVLVLVPALYALLDDLGVTALSDRRAAEHRELAAATPEGA